MAYPVADPSYEPAEPDLADPVPHPEDSPGDKGPPKPPPGDRRAPQESINRFWKKFYAKHTGKVLTVLPENPYAQQKISKASKGITQAQRAVRSYEQAKEECLRDVTRIIRECRRVNRKYRDAHFDVETDLKRGKRFCLRGLQPSDEEYEPKAVKRVSEIFENPQFFIHGASAGDVVQGEQLGDCYLMAALCGLGGMPGLIDKVCVIQDQAVGIYGFVFHRDGEWQQCIIDDQLYLTAPDYDESYTERRVWDNISRRDTEEEYRRTQQTGSRSLYFAKCSDANETWLPLLEKAYAKAHGDYAALCGGWTGEAIEDLTGGVISELQTSDILDKDAFWVDEILQVGKDFLYGCSTGQYADWLEPDRTTRERQGIFEGHAYSVIGAVEHMVDGKKYRLVKVRNPWGNHGWNGAWSDGSAEWTPQWMERLNHKFGDDGLFWMSYVDFLKKFQRLDRTRIFGDDWSIAQQWTSVHVPWSVDYHQTRFAVAVTRTTPVVIVLSQLDARYFRGLEGQYLFKLQFRVQKHGDENDYIVRSNQNYDTSRSVSTEILLEEGSYVVLMKITATRHGTPPLEKAIANLTETLREKFIQVGLSYDVAHAKGVVVETEDERVARENRATAKTKKQREKWKNERKATAEKAYRKAIRLDLRDVKREECAERRRKNFRPAGHGWERAEPERDEQEARAESGDGPPGNLREEGSSSADLGASWAGSESAATEQHSAMPLPPREPQAEGQDGPPKANETTVAPQEDGEASIQKSPLHLPDGTPALVPTVQVNGVGDVSTNECKKVAKPPAERGIGLSDECQNVGPSEQKSRAEESNGAASEGKSEGQSLIAGAASADTDSLDGLDWQSDLDYDSDAYAKDVQEHKAAKEARAAEEYKDNDDVAVPGGSDPWNAVCVVGLRVYSQDPNLSLQVVRPTPYDREDAASDKADGDGGPTGELDELDRDDPAKGAVAEQWAKTPSRAVFDTESDDKGRD